MNYDVGECVEVFLHDMNNHKKKFCATINNKWGKWYTEDNNKHHNQTLKDTTTRMTRGINNDDVEVLKFT